MTRIVRSFPNIRVIEGEVTELPEKNAVICTGPLTSDALAEKIRGICGEGIKLLRRGGTHRFGGQH